ncbi:hypothetical protein PgNI_11191 [Pyricularia grisea]|uniref:Uncharacterized protein n=1 Tax=Pyricularia grisea TaxID=148305 RepID=A0A6P8APD2_PYRGI|nr:hypothetical protein PgNI_11191 [Pyricularia grisea]TLD03892.1 hypothetical protein PgNI_11191 [Pyricularia grisea]
MAWKGLRSSNVEVLATTAISQGQPQDQDQLRHARVRLVAVVSGNVGPGGGGQVRRLVVLLLLEQLLHAADSTDADGSEEVLRDTLGTIEPLIRSQEIVET